MHRTVALALLLTLAGCGMPSALDRPSTATSAPIPESTPAAYPPGVDHRGVYDPGQLIGAHTGLLENASYTAHVRSVHHTVQGGIHAEYTRVIRLSAGEERVHYSLDQTDFVDGAERVRHVEQYRNGSRLAMAVRVGGETSYRVRQLNRSRSLLATTTLDRQGFGRLIVRFRPALRDTITENGTTRYRLAAGPTDLRPLQNVTFHAVVDRRGLVREYDVTYTVRRDGDLIRVRVEVAFTDVGKTTVPRPTWVDRAQTTTTKQQPD